MNSGELRWTKTERQKDRNTKRQYTGLIKLPHEFQWSNMNYDKRLIIILDYKIAFLVSKKPLSCLSNLMNLTKISKVVFSKTPRKVLGQMQELDNIFLGDLIKLGRNIPPQ